MQRERARLGDLKGIIAYDWAPDGKAILVPLDGDLYLATLDGAVTRLTNTPEGELNPVVSPKGGFVSFVRDGNLYVEGIADRRETKVTKDGGGLIHWGEAQFVAPGGNGPRHRLLVVARRQAHRDRSRRREPGRRRHPCCDRRHRHQGL